MEFNIRPFHKNSYPRQGVLIKSPDAAVWLHETYKMGLDPESAAMYAVPGLVANRLLGCLVVPKTGGRIADARSNSLMQCLNGRLYIPENTVVFPELAAGEWEKHFPEGVYIMHPDTGLATLTEAIDWGLLVAVQQPAPAVVITPSKGVYIPQAIRSISIEADEQALAENIENQVGDGLKDIGINREKILKGNEREIDKLLKYLEKHPEAALTMGIPLDVMGSARGDGGGKFVFGKGITGGGGSNSELRTVLFALAAIAGIIFLFVIFSQGSSTSFPFFFIFLIGRLIYSFIKPEKDPPRRTGSGRNAIIESEKFAYLQKTYNKLAEDYLARKEYQKAAGVYLKLLKNYWRAAQVLEEGGFYGEAGAIYLKYCKSKEHAAECFEKGRLYTQAIDIYKELENHEKVGDLYMLLHQEKEAIRYYNMVAEDYVNKKQYVKASLIFRKKMNQPQRAQAELLEGWHKKLDAHNCLTNYFANIEGTGALIAEIQRFYEAELEDSRREAFLQVIKGEFHKDEALQAPVRDIAYEIIAACIETTPFIASELIAFNPRDKSLTKDVMKFKAQRIKRKG